MRQVVGHALVLQGKFQHLRDGQRLVVRDEEVADVLVLDGPLASSHDVFHEVDVGGLVRRQVQADIHGEQAVRENDY